MQTIHLQIQDNLYEQLIKSGVNIQEKFNEVLYDMLDDGYPSISTQEAKKRVADAVEQYKNGTMHTVSSDDMWQQIDMDCKAKSEYSVQSKL